MKKNILLTILVLIIVFTTSCSGDKNSAAITDSTGISTTETMAVNLKLTAPKEELLNTKEVTVTDYNGNIITLDYIPKRVIALGGTSLMVTSLFTDDIVGSAILSEEAPKPAIYDSLEKLGKMSAIDLEKLIELKPDFVFVQSQTEKLIPNLEENNIPYYVFKAQTYSDILEQITNIGVIFRNAELTQKYVDFLENSVKSAKINAEKISMEIGKNLSDIKVAIVHVAGSGLTLKLEKSIAGDIVKMLGIKNIAEGLSDESDSLPFDLEMLVAEDPDIIFITSMLSADKDPSQVLNSHLKDGSAFTLLTAYKEGRIHYLPQNLFLFNPVMEYDDAINFILDRIN